MWLGKSDRTKHSRVWAQSCSWTVEQGWGQGSQHIPPAPERPPMVYRAGGGPWEVLGLPVPWPCPGSCSRSFCHIFRGLFFYIGCNLQLGMSHQVAPLRAAPQTPTAPRGTGAPASPVPCGATGSCAALGRTGTHQPGCVRPGHGQHRGLCGWVILFSELHPVSPPCAMPVQGPDGNYFLSGQSVACQMRESG